jgi:hypothetical protein
VEIDLFVDLLLSLELEALGWLQLVTATTAYLSAYLGTQEVGRLRLRSELTVLTKL